MMVCRSFLLWRSSFGAGTKQTLLRVQSTRHHKIRIPQGAFLKALTKYTYVKIVCVQFCLILFCFFILHYLLENSEAERSIQK